MGRQAQHRRATCHCLVVLPDDDIVCLASWIVDACHCGNQKHSTYGTGVHCRLGAQIGRKPFFDAQGAVPFETVEIVPHGIEGAFVGAEFDGLEHRLASDLWEPYTLKPFLQLRDVFGREWAGQQRAPRFRARRAR